MYLDKFEVMIWSILASLAILIGVCIYMLIQEDQACKSAGGHWVGTGEYYTVTTTVLVGKVAVPQTQTHEEEVCVNKKTNKLIELGE